MMQALTPWLIGGLLFLLLSLSAQLLAGLSLAGRPFLRLRLALRRNRRFHLLSQSSRRHDR